MKLITSLTEEELAALVKVSQKARPNARQRKEMELMKQAIKDKRAA